MTDPLTPDDLERMRAKHRLLELDYRFCSCGAMYPCDAVRLLDEVERLRGRLSRIAALDPEDSTEGYNEWGEAEMFRRAQEIATQSEAPSVSEGGKPLRCEWPRRENP